MSRKARRHVSDRRSKPRRLSIDSLEARNLLATFADFSAFGRLRVTGDNTLNIISIGATGGTVWVTDGVANVTITGGPALAAGVSEIFVEALDGFDVINASGVNTASGFSAATLNGDVTLSGNSGGDGIIGSEFNDEIWGFTGNDTLQGRNGNDSIDGDDGADSIFGGSGNDSLEGGEGDDKVWGEEGADSLWGEGFGWSESLSATSNDSLSGGSNNDTVDGQFGDDLLIGDDATAGWIPSESQTNGADRIVQPFVCKVSLG